MDSAAVIRAEDALLALLPAPAGSQLAQAVAAVVGRPYPGADATRVVTLGVNPPDITVRVSLTTSVAVLSPTRVAAAQQAVSAAAANRAPAAVAAAAVAAGAGPGAVSVAIPGPAVLVLPPPPPPLGSTVPGGPARPSGGASVSPLSGTAISSVFVVTPQRWTGAPPITYAIAYQLLQPPAAPSLWAPTTASLADPVFITDYSPLPQGQAGFSVRLPVAGSPQVGSVVQVLLYGRSGATGLASLTPAAVNVTVLSPLAGLSGGAAAGPGTQQQDQPGTTAAAAIAGAAALVSAALPGGPSAASSLGDVVQVSGGVAAILNQAAALPGGADAAAAAAAAPVRANLIGGVLAAVQLAAQPGSPAPLSPAGVAAAVTALSALVAGPPQQLTPQAQAAAASALQLLSASGAMVSLATGAAAGAALSSVATAALAASVGSAWAPGGASASSWAAAPTATAATAPQLGGGSNNATGVLATVFSAVDALCRSLLGSMAAGSPPFFLDTPLIKARLAVDPQSPASRLLTQPLAIPGVLTTVFPLPPAALASAPPGAAVTSMLLVVPFNPYGITTAGAAAPAPTSGVSRLVLGAQGGADLSVQNLATPLQFTLPSPAAANTGLEPQCAFYDTARSAVSTAGCARLPTAIPPGHALSLRPGFAATDDSSLARAWVLSGPLAANCTEAFVDCAATPLAQVLFNPQQPFAAGAVGCTPGGFAGTLRVYSGPRCALASANAPGGCAWDAVAQRFAGPGCVPTAPQGESSATCLCRHATDFLAFSQSASPLATLYPFQAPRPHSAPVKLTFLIASVGALFLLLEMGGAFGVWIDAKERRWTFRLITTEEFGFSTDRVTGAWVWCVADNNTPYPRFSV